MPTREAYEKAFRREAIMQYPAIDIFEAKIGYAIDDDLLLAMARVLACPIKKNPPNWQHGRVVYALARKRLATLPVESHPWMFVDIGTAKGFSALCALWAASASDRPDVTVVTTDVIDPKSTEPRNSVLDLYGPIPLADYWRGLLPAPSIVYGTSPGLQAVHGTGVELLENLTDDIPFAFVDGKHSTDAVMAEIELLAERQRPGDYIVFDDLHMRPVRRAVATVEAYGYHLSMIHPCKERAYGWAVKV